VNEYCVWMNEDWKWKSKLDTQWQRINNFVRRQNRKDGKQTLLRCVYCDISNENSHKVNIELVKYANVSKNYFQILSQMSITCYIFFFVAFNILKWTYCGEFMMLLAINHEKTAHHTSNRCIWDMIKTNCHQTHYMWCLCSDIINFIMASSLNGFILLFLHIEKTYQTKC
jgi:Na+/alanine symporter